VSSTVRIIEHQRSAGVLIGVGVAGSAASSSGLAAARLAPHRRSSTHVVEHYGSVCVVVAYLKFYIFKVFSCDIDVNRVSIVLWLICSRLHVARQRIAELKAAWDAPTTTGTLTLFLFLIIYFF